MDKELSSADLGQYAGDVPASWEFQAAQCSLTSQFRAFLGALRTSPDRRLLFLFSVGIVIVIVGTAVGQVKLNAWNQPFYDAISDKNLSAFGFQLLVFLSIVSVLLAMNIVQGWLHSMIKVYLRKWLTHDLIDEWLKPARASQMAWAGEIGTNPDQRIHEDARHLTELSADLAIGLFQSLLLLGSFVGVLWILSRDVVFSYAGQEFAIPGYMVWCAVLFAVTGSWFSWLIGRPLIPLSVERYAREADLRFALVRVNENADGIALHCGEADERRRLRAELDRVLEIMRDLVGASMRLTWVTAGYGWVALIAPILVAAPGYFSGSLSFGGLMMVVSAFYQVQQALRWFVDNFGRIADWRATLLRVMAFRQALLSIETQTVHHERIDIDRAAEEVLGFEELSLSSGDRRNVLNEKQVEVQPGDRVLIMARPGASTSTLFRALAGLWPWGSGRIRLPPRDALMFLPRRPYLPLGTLREAISYPAPPTAFSTSAVVTALKRTGLGSLAPRLDAAGRWDKDLTLDEQQRIAFCRLLLQRPRWVVIDEGIDTLDEDHRKIVVSIFERELVECAVVCVGRRASSNPFYTRKLHLRRFPTPRKDATRSRSPVAAAPEAAPDEPLDDRLKSEA